MQAQLARELVETQWFIFLILFMALTVHKFLGVAHTRIESNGFFKVCTQFVLSVLSSPNTKLSFSEREKKIKKMIHVIRLVFVSM